MQIFKKLLDFYFNSSIHVALSVGSLVLMTQYMFHIFDDTATLYFAFFGTIVGYNFVKYDALARTQKLQMRNQLKGIAFLSFLSLTVTTYYFFQLQRVTQIIGFVFFVIILLYTLPFFPNRKNARNWAGIKIYIVALCWVGVTLVLPIINAGIPIATDFYLKCLQRFLLIFVLILIFEIIDLLNDDPHLKTVPQQIGVKQTKILGFVLLLIFCSLEVFNVYSNDNIKIQFIDLPLQMIVAVVIAIFLAFSNEFRSKYYTSFWVESIPIIWYLLLRIYPIWHNV
jgi:hypothetical protein